MIVLVVVRPRFTSISRRGPAGRRSPGVVTAGVTLLFMASVARLPLGTASALEFLGPLGVAVARSRGRRNLVWPALAPVGVLLLTEPWSGGVDRSAAFALGAAVVLGVVHPAHAGRRRRGDRTDRARRSLPVAGIIATRRRPGTGRSSWDVALIGIGLAVLLPVVPFSLELLALRRLTTRPSAPSCAWSPRSR